MKVITKDMGFDDFALLFLQLVVVGMVLFLFGPFSVIITYSGVKFLAPAAERQGLGGLIALYLGAFFSLFGLMILWWYLVLGQITPIPWSKEC